MNRPGKYLLALMAMFAMNANAAVTASVDRTRMTESDSLQLIIRATEGEPVNDTDLGPVERDFDVVTRSTSSRLSIVNGKRERSSDLQVVLLPRRAGTLRIPPLTVGNQRTQAILIEVGEAPSGIDNARDVFVEAEVDRDSVFVQSQLIHTFRVYEAIDLVDRGRSQLELPDAIIEELDSSTFQRTVNGRTYRVIEVRHAIFPQKSGQLTIPAMSFNGSRMLPRRSFFDRNVETLRRRSKPITVEVKPIPANYPDAPWIPAASLKLEESWSALPEDLEVGDSVTRTVTLLAKGIDGSQLPPLELSPVDGIKAYPDQPRSENTRDQDGITGIGINSTALLITAPGEFELPALRVPWWDTEENRLRFAELPAQRISIAATALPAPTEPITATALPTGDGAAPLAPSGQNSLWMWATLAALLGWLTTTSWLLWRMQPREAAAVRDEKDADEAKLFKTLIRACEENQATQTRAGLQHWAQASSGDTSLPTLEDLRRRFADEKLAAELDELERSLFSSSPTNWNGSELASTLRRWRKQVERDGKTRSPALPPLYPVGSK